MEQIDVLQKTRKLILAGAGVAWVARGLLDNAYVNYPRIPDAAQSRTVPYEVKRVVVYVTKLQSDVICMLEWTEIVSGGLILISLILNQWRPIRQ